MAARYLLLVVAFCPVLLWGIGLAHFGVDIPRDDQWYTPYDAIVEAFSDDVSLRPYLRQHNESRKLFPTILSVGLARLMGSWDLQRELFLGHALSLTILVLMAALFMRTLPQSPIAASFFVLCFSFCMWSPLTNRFRLISVSFERLIPEVCLLVAVILWLGRPRPYRLALAFGGLAFVALYSYAGGILIGCLLALLLAADPRELGSRRISSVALFLLLFVAAVVAYFWGYHTPENHSQPGDSLNEAAADLIWFISAFLGNPFARKLTDCGAMGLVLLVLLATALVALWQSRGDARNLRFGIGWTILMAYSLGQAAMAAITRLPMSITHAIRGDYISHAWYLAYAALAILWIHGGRNLPRARLGVAVLGLLLTSVVLAQGFRHPLGRTLRRRQFGLLSGKACAQLVDLHRVPVACLDRLASPGAGLAPRIRQLHRVGALQPGLAPGIRVTEDRYSGGHVLRAAWEGDSLRLEGWATVEGSEADAVVVTGAPSPGSTEHVVSVGRSGQRLSDAEAGPGVPRYAGWMARLEWDGPRVSRGMCSLRLYAFQTSTNRFFRIPWSEGLCSDPMPWGDVGVNHGDAPGQTQ